MTLTSAFLVLIMIMIWKTHILLIISYIVVVISVELLYLTSVLYKFNQGGYLPLAFATVLMTVMFVWNNVYRRKYHYDLHNKISPEKLKEIAANKNMSISRMPGLALFYSELVHGIPPIFEHYITNVPSLHRVLVFLSVKSLPISKVPAEERFLFRRVEPKELYVFRCVVRYGYRDVRSEESEQQPFERTLVERLKEFIREEFWLSSKDQEVDEEDEEGRLSEEIKKEEREMRVEREMEEVDKAMRDGAVHLIGQNEIVAGKGAGIGKRIMIDYAYNFMKRNLRESEKVFDIPHKRMLRVGMTYEL